MSTASPTDEDSAMDWEEDVPATQKVGGYVVLDTNIVISHSSWVKASCGTIWGPGSETLPNNMGMIVLAIPWTVLCELDKLKVSKDHDLAARARRANRVFFEMLSRRDGSITGQKRWEKTDLGKDPKSSNDDRILDYCVYLVKKTNLRVALVSNDNNLLAKSSVYGITSLDWNLVVKASGPKVMENVQKIEQEYSRRSQKHQQEHVPPLANRQEQQTRKATQNQKQAVSKPQKPVAMAVEKVRVEKPSPMSLVKEPKKAASAVVPANTDSIVSNISPNWDLILKSNQGQVVATAPLQTQVSQVSSSSLPVFNPLASLVPNAFNLPSQPSQMQQFNMFASRNNGVISTTNNSSIESNQMQIFSSGGIQNDTGTFGQFQGAQQMSSTRTQESFAYSSSAQPGKMKQEVKITAASGSHSKKFTKTATEAVMAKKIEGSSNNLSRKKTVVTTHTKEIKQIVTMIKTQQNTVEMISDERKPKITEIFSGSEDDEDDEDEDALDNIVPEKKNEESPPKRKLLIVRPKKKVVDNDDDDDDDDDDDEKEKEKEKVQPKKKLSIIRPKRDNDNNSFNKKLEKLIYAFVLNVTDIIVDKLNSGCLKGKWEKIVGSKPPWTIKQLKDILTTHYEVLFDSKTPETYEKVLNSLVRKYKTYITDKKVVSKKTYENTYGDCLRFAMSFFQSKKLTSKLQPFGI